MCTAGLLLSLQGMQNFDPSVASPQSTRLCQAQPRFISPVKHADSNCLGYSTRSRARKCLPVSRFVYIHLTRISIFAAFHENMAALAAGHSEYSPYSQQVAPLYVNANGEEIDAATQPVAFHPSAVASATSSSAKNGNYFKHSCSRTYTGCSESALPDIAGFSQDFDDDDDGDFNSAAEEFVVGDEDQEEEEEEDDDYNDADEFTSDPAQMENDEMMRFLVARPVSNTNAFQHIRLQQTDNSDDALGVASPTKPVDDSVCRGNVVERPSWHELSEEEKLAYVNAVNCLMERPSERCADPNAEKCPEPDSGIFTSLYDDFVYQHMETADLYHFTPVLHFHPCLTCTSVSCLSIVPL